MILYFSNSLLSFIREDINLFFFFLSPPLIFRISRANGLITSSKYPIKYLELFFVVTNFEVSILSKLASLVCRTIS